MHAIVLQCGGPAAVVNATLAALVRRWHTRAAGRTIFGGHHGLRALVTSDWPRGPLAPSIGPWLPAGHSSSSTRFTRSALISPRFFFDRIL
ncbi:MAG TPA: hypothetical protein VHH91_09545, partial [Vicinamibacterales bacterium]|nr:hypothetical protein [Vicinamibacterales bacterium]